MRNIIIFLLISIVVFVTAIFFVVRPTLQPVKFSSINPNIKVSKSESVQFDIYSNYKLMKKVTG